MNPDKDDAREIFPMESELSQVQYTGDRGKFNKEIIQVRKQIGIKDAAIDIDNGAVDFDSFTSLKEGKTRVVCRDVPVDLFYSRGTDEEYSKLLYIFFNGAIGGTPRPVFQRWSYTSKSSVLCIADPLFTEKGIGLGWYIGTKDVDYRPILRDLISRILEIIKIKNENTIFFASSSGGQPAIILSSYFRGSLSVTINPQLDITLYDKKSYEELINRCGFGANDEEFNRRNNALLPMKNAKENKFVIFINALSESDLRQLDLLRKNFGIDVRYGLNIKDNIYVWIYSADPVLNGKVNWSAHSSLDDRYIFLVIDGFIRKMIEGQIPDDPTVYTAFSEIWHDLYIVKHDREQRDLLLRSRAGDPKAQERLCLDQKDKHSDDYKRNLIKTVLNGNEKKTFALLRFLNDNYNDRDSFLKDFLKIYQENRIELLLSQDADLSRGVEAADEKTADSAIAKMMDYIIAEGNPYDFKLAGKIYSKGVIFPKDEEKAQTFFEKSGFI
jgi:hypothetical protein